MYPPITYAFNNANAETMLSAVYEVDPTIFTRWFVAGRIKQIMQEGRVHESTYSWYRKYFPDEVLPSQNVATRLTRKLNLRDELPSGKYRRVPIDMIDSLVDQGKSSGFHPDRDWSYDYHQSTNSEHKWFEFTVDYESANSEHK